MRPLDVQRKMYGHLRITVPSENSPRLPVYVSGGHIVSREIVCSSSAILSLVTCASFPFGSAASLSFSPSSPLTPVRLSPSARPVQLDSLCTLAKRSRLLFVCRARETHLGVVERAG